MENTTNHKPQNTLKWTNHQTINRLRHLNTQLFRKRILGLLMCISVNIFMAKNAKTQGIGQPIVSVGFDSATVEIPVLTLYGADSSGLAYVSSDSSKAVSGWVQGPASISTIPFTVQQLSILRRFTIHPTSGIIYLSAKFPHNNTNGEIFWSIADSGTALNNQTQITYYNVETTNTTPEQQIDNPQWKPDIKDTGDGSITFLNLKKTDIIKIYNTDGKCIGQTYGQEKFSLPKSGMFIYYIHQKSGKIYRGKMTVNK